MATVAALECLTEGDLVGDILTHRSDAMSVAADPLLAAEDLNGSQSEVAVAKDRTTLIYRSLVAMHDSPRRLGK